MNQTLVSSTVIANSISMKCVINQMFMAANKIGKIWIFILHCLLHYVSSPSQHQILNLTGSTGFLYQLEVENVRPMRGFQPLLHGRLLELLGASTQLAICSKSPCSIAISSCPYLQDAISSSPPLQLSRKVVRTRSEHSSQSAHTLHYVRTHPGTIVEQNLVG
jgi:hypothetical protein